MEDQTSKAVFKAKSDFLPKHLTLNKMICPEGHLPESFSRFQNVLNCTSIFTKPIEINRLRSYRFDSCPFAIPARGQ
jgi:hypothetical protein